MVSPAQFKSLFLQDTPFLDVRAEIECEKGSFPHATNIPLLTTDERHQVGSCYKKHGQEAAIELGHQLVGGKTREERIEQWSNLAKSTPSLHLFCWRGGLRSRLTQEALADVGLNIPLIEGGYKALRNFLLEQLKQLSETGRFIIIGGKTGSAKTPLVNNLSSGVDLEHFANHRGSTFGRRVCGPPSQVNFENALIIDLIKKHESHPDKPIFLEDESRRVGSCAIPQDFFQTMKNAPIAIVEVPIEQRIEHILKEYVQQSVEEYLVHFGESGFNEYQTDILASLGRIKKKLGGERHQQLDKALSEAIDQQRKNGNTDAYRPVIQRLLIEYYDPMYNYQMSKLGERIIFTGSDDEVLDWASRQ